MVNSEEKMSSEAACVLCNSTVDDALQLGEKITCEDTTAHLYCLLLTSNLVQNGDDDEGISGFMPKDIKNEVSRTKKLFCHYCREKGATIGCCFKSCRRSFHLPCALQNDCKLEFTNTFRSFCDTHHEIKRPKHVHKPTDLCTVCYDEMGKYNPIRSIPLPCCNKNAWCHKLCLQQYAQTSGYFLKCPLCKDSDKFRQFIAERGVFIPDRDAKWEVEDSGPNTFYDFEQHSERPSKCEAPVCKCKKGRTYQVDIENHKYSLAFCHYCGSHAVHMACFKGEDYLCEECTTIANRVRENAANASSSNHHRFDDFLQSRRHLITQFKLREFSIILARLTPEEIVSTPEPTIEPSAESGASSTNQSDDSSSDESVIKPVTPNKKRPMAFATSTSECDFESEMEVKPAKRQRILPRRQFFDSESESDQSDQCDSDCVMNTGTNVDINDNSTDCTTNKAAELDFLFGLRVRQFSTSEEEQIRPCGSSIRKPLILESSDDQNYGKENEKPMKSIAVVRPYPHVETSSDESIKPFKLKARAHQQISSSDEANDLFTPPFVPRLNQTYPNYKQGTITAIEVDERSGGEGERESNTQTKMAATALSQSKKKRRTVISYFRQSSSSDEELIESKPKRKSPKSPKKKRTMPEVAPNQSTIKDFFTKQLFQNI